MKIAELCSYAEKVLSGGEITPEEGERLITLPDTDTPLLLALADKIRQHFCGDAVSCCAILNSRSGSCPEDCRFCAQSSHYQTNIQSYPLLDKAAILDAAKKAKEKGASRFSIVTSGRSVREGAEFAEILRAISSIWDAGLQACCSLGLITASQARELKRASVSHYHANIETAPSYFSHICSTHGIDDKIRLIRAVQDAGVSVCSGGILGLGESPRQRVEMAFTLKRLGIRSIPLNILTPIQGTPLAHAPQLPPLEILRAFAVFRFILPQALIRTAGGREVNLRSLQPFALTGGLNGLMIGGYLTTKGNDQSADMEMLRDLGRKPACPANDGQP